MLHAALHVKFASLLFMQNSNFCICALGLALEPLPSELAHIRYIHIHRLQTDTPEYHNDTDSTCCSVFISE